MSRTRVTLGPAFDIEISKDRTSGFRPADTALGGGKRLFGNWRLLAFCAALRRNLTDVLIVAGGDEARHKDQRPPVNRAEAIRKMLVLDFGFNTDRVVSIPSKSNTAGNAKALMEFVTGEGWDPDELHLITNDYHLARTLRSLALAGIRIKPTHFWTAEELVLLENPSLKDALVFDFRRGLAERVGDEQSGLAAMTAGTYRAVTDTAPRSS